MKQIKHVVFVLIVVASLFGCKKNHTQRKICHGSFAAVKPVSADSAVISKIDDNGASSMYTEFSPVTVFGPNERSMCYNKNDSCLYFLRGDDMTEDIYLYKCNLSTKQTEKLICTNPDAIDYVPNFWDLRYNSFTKEFYIGYFYLGATWYITGRIKLTITGNTFSAKHYFVPGLQPNKVLPYFIDEQTGDMYFYQVVFDQVGFLRYSPITGDTTQVDYPGDMSSGSEYNPNDGKVYWCNSAKKLVRFDPKTGLSIAYGFLNANIDSVTGTTFDECNNQFVFYINSDVVNIYWVDVSNGNIAKHITTQDNYFSLIHIPQTQ